MERGRRRRRHHSGAGGGGCTWEFASRLWGQREGEGRYACIAVGGGGIGSPVKVGRGAERALYDRFQKHATVSRRLLSCLGCLTVRAP